MKKLTFLLLITFSLVGCSLEDDGPNRILEFAEITEVDLPEYFEYGKTYTFTITYLLPSACHIYNGIDTSQGQATNGFEVYIGVITSYDANLTTCNREEENLTRETTLREVTITGEIGTVYIFKFYRGKNSEGEIEYHTVEVPVRDLENSGENNENTNE